MTKITICSLATAKTFTLDSQWNHRSSCLILRRLSRRQWRVKDYSDGTFLLAKRLCHHGQSTDVSMPCPVKIVCSCAYTDHLSRQHELGNHPRDDATIQKDSIR